ncbi:AraC family transcriptional regulator ligand-binding domain-containing protein [Rhizobium helianthi]|uniref:AraC family transcriptional regulator ligand-binding domain-containing protein n=1 Tax=Rhizobium helianthi TaxID=1132695 RepID=A0ABW4M7Q0_9HYPH
MERRMISPGFVDDALECLRRRGIDPANILEECGIPDALAQPVSNVAYGNLWWRIAAEVQDEFFNLAARPMRPGSFSLLCHCLLTCKNLDEAIQRALIFLGVVLDEPGGTLHRTGSEAQIQLVSSEPRSAFAFRTYWLILMGVSSWLVGRRLPLRRLEFACAAPERRDDYRQFFGAPVSFDCEQTRLVLDVTLLDLPVVRDEQALKHFLRDAPANILIRYRHDQGLTGKIRQILAQAPPADWPKFESIAEELKLAPATLRRRLKAEGQSYGAIKDEIRIVIAERLLREETLNVADIANQLGYSEPSAFYRAYRKMTGATPRSMN